MNSEFESATLDLVRVQCVEERKREHLKQGNK